MVLGRSVLADADADAEAEAGPEVEGNRATGGVPVALQLLRHDGDLQSGWERHTEKAGAAPVERGDGQLVGRKLQGATAVSVGGGVTGATAAAGVVAEGGVAADQELAPGQGAQLQRFSHGGAPSHADQIGPQLCQTLFVADQLIPVEVTRLLLVAVPQILELVTHRVQHRMVVVQQPSPKDKENLKPGRIGVGSVGGAQGCAVQPFQQFGSPEAVAPQLHIGIRRRPETPALKGKEHLLQEVTPGSDAAQDDHAVTAVAVHAGLHGFNFTHCHLAGGCGLGLCRLTLRRAGPCRG